MKKLIFILCVFIATNCFAQYGTGNNTFSLTIKKVETYFISPTTVSKFEKNLGTYQIEEIDTTRYENAPMKIGITYVNNPKDDILYKVYISCDSLQKITSIRYSIEDYPLSADNLQTFMGRLKSAGYKYDKNATKFHTAMSGAARKYFYHNPVKKIYVSVYIISNNEYLVNFSKQGY